MGKPRNRSFTCYQCKAQYPEKQIDIMCSGCEEDFCVNCFQEFSPCVECYDSFCEECVLNESAESHECVKNDSEDNYSSEDEKS